MPDDPAPDSLPAEARPAYEAYLAMAETKQAYFSYMAELDRRQKDGGEISLAENLKLEQLLKAHDEQVAAFNKAMQAIKQTDDQMLHALIRAMSDKTLGQGPTGGK